MTCPPGRVLAKDRRQSFIQIRIATSAGRITEILVGGRVVPVIEGRLRVP